MIPTSFIAHLIPLQTPSNYHQPTCATPSPKTAAITLLATTIALSTLPPTHAYGLQNNRLQKCTADLPCISTSSIANPTKFGPPWTYEPQTSSAATAWASLKHAVADSKDRGAIVESLDGPELFYLRAEFPGFIRGVDDVEFRLLKDDALVTYRSCSREAIYLYPLQTPVNTDKNRTRLLDIRKRLGWEELDGFNVYGLDNP